MRPARRKKGAVSLCSALLCSKERSSIPHGCHAPSVKKRWSVTFSVHQSCRLRLFDGNTKIIYFIRAKILSFRPYNGETIRPDRAEILYVRQFPIPLALNVGLYVKALCLPIVKTNFQYIVFFRKNINSSRTQHIPSIPHGCQAPFRQNMRSSHLMYRPASADS